jgi:LPXTG-motif cell wall-anchored protein
LPHTGSTSAALALLGVMLLAGGSLMVRATRRSTAG